MKPSFVASSGGPIQHECYLIAKHIYLVHILKQTTGIFAFQLCSKNMKLLQLFVSIVQFILTKLLNVFGNQSHSFCTRKSNESCCSKIEFS